MQYSSMKKIGAVILAGGKSRRMHENKAFLTLEGQTFLNIISNQLDEFEEVLLSVDDAAKYACENIADHIKIIGDIYPDCGPLGGIYTSLRFCKSDYLLTVGCDMPLFKKELADYMCSFVDDSHDAFVLVTRDGRLQPQCAIYGTHIADIMEEYIKAEDYRIVSPYEKIRVKYILLEYSIFPDYIVRGVNTPTEYINLSGCAHKSCTI